MGDLTAPQTRPHLKLVATCARSAHASTSKSKRHIQKETETRGASSSRGDIDNVWLRSAERSAAIEKGEQTVLKVFAASTAIALALFAFTKQCVDQKQTMPKEAQLQVQLPSTDTATALGYNSRGTDER